MRRPLICCATLSYNQRLNDHQQKETHLKGLRCTGLLIALLPVVAACSGSKAGSDNAAPAAAATADAGASTSASTNKICALYTPSEISGILGANVGGGEAAGPMATACQWSPKGSGDTFAQIQIIPGTRYWEKHEGAKGYEVLKGIGKEAYVATSLGGWEAGTVTDKTVVFVSLAGGTASRNSVVDFLKRTMAKLGPGT
jgi:hypothetical protein